MEASNSGAKVTLPAGVKIIAGYETSQVNDQGQVAQGMKFTIGLPNGSQTTVFIPYTELGDTAKVQSVIDARVNAIKAITG